MESLKTPVTIFGLPLLLISLHAVAVVTNIYEVVYFFDSIMHFSGGIICALSITGMIAYAQDRAWIVLDDRNVFRLLVIGLTGLITIGWELFELGLYLYTGVQFQPSISDTIKDEILGVLGAVLVVLKIRS